MPRLGGDDDSEEEEDEKNEKKSKTVEKLSDGKQQKAGQGMGNLSSVRCSWFIIATLASENGSLCRWPTCDFMAT